MTRNQNNYKKKIITMSTIMFIIFSIIIGLFCIANNSISLANTRNIDNVYASTEIADNFNLITYEAGETEEMYVMVNFVSFDDGDKFTADEIAQMKKNFNDNTAGNDTFSMHEYFYAQSQGKLNVWALFMEHTTTVYTKSHFNYQSANGQLQYNNEEAVFKNALQENTDDFIFNGKTIKDFTCRINYFAGNAVSSSDSLFWPKNWYNPSTGKAEGLITYVQSIDDTKYPRFVGVICHELSHLMGIPDYYTNISGFYPVWGWDLMSITNRDNPQSLSPHFRQQMGWFDESYYYDNKTTQIEYISSSGTYTIKDSTSQDGVLGYKFGIRNKDKTEFFMIEFKDRNYTSSAIDYFTYDDRLLIYRIDTEVEDGNLLMSSPDKCGMYIFRKNDINTSEGAKYAGISTTTNDGCLTSYGAKNGTSNIICYADGTNSGIVVSNFDITSSGTATFDIDFLNEVYSSSGIVKVDGSPFSGVTVCVNEQATTTTDENGYYFLTDLSQGDIISFVKSDYEIETTFTISENALNNDVDVITKKDLTFSIKFNGISLQDVQVLVGGEVKGTTLSNGQVTIPNVPVKALITFYHEQYDFNPSSITFTDVETTMYDVVATLAKRNLTINFKINGVALADVGVYKQGSSTPIAVSGTTGNATISNAEIFSVYTFTKTNYEFSPSSITFTTISTTEFEVVAQSTKIEEGYNTQLFIHDFDTNATISSGITFKLNNTDVMDYNYEDGLWYLNSSVNDELVIQKEGYKPLFLTISQTIIDTKPYNLKIYQYQTVTYILKDRFDAVIPNAQVFNNGLQIGTTNAQGQYQYNQFVTRDNIIFKAQYFDDKTVIFDAKNIEPNITLSYADVELRINMIKLDNTSTFHNDVILKINDSLSTFYIDNNQLVLTAKYFDEITLSKSGFEFTDIQVLTSNAEQVYQTLVREYFTIKGKISYKNGELLQLRYTILQDGKKIGTTDNKGKFNLTILEGSELVFTTYGYASNKLVVDKNYDNIDLQVELKNQPSDFVLIIILSFFGVLLVLGVVNTFRRKKS